MNKLCTLSLGLVPLTLLGARPWQAVRPASAPALTAEQLQILSHLELVQLPDGQGGTVPTIRFTGVNVQIVNGLGATNGYPADPASSDPTLTRTNGTGNLVLGYGEAPLSGAGDRTGSHNLVVGVGHEYRSFGGAVIGHDNTIDGPYASVAGGFLNRAGQLCASVSGGSNNLANAPHATVGGGAFNWATGDGAFVGGGFRSLANGAYASVSGGYKSVASGPGASVNGGDRCRATGDRSTVSGGSERIVSGFADWGAGSLFEEQ